MTYTYAHPKPAMLSELVTALSEELRLYGDRLVRSSCDNEAIEGDVVIVRSLEAIYLDGSSGEVRMSEGDRLIWGTTR